MCTTFGRYFWGVHNFRSPFGDLQTAYGHLQIDLVHRQTLPSQLICVGHASGIVVERPLTNWEVHSSILHGSRTFCQATPFWFTVQFSMAAEHFARRLLFVMKISFCHESESFSNVLFQRNTHRFASAQKLSCTIQTAQDLSANVTYCEKCAFWP